MEQARTEIKIEKHGSHQIITFPNGEKELVYNENIGMHRFGLDTVYVQKDGRYYVEEESQNVREMGNVLRRISRRKFEEIYNLIVSCPVTEA